MKKIILLLFFVPASVALQAQPDTNSVKITVSEDVKECINQIYDDPQALKYLLQTLLSDREKFRETYSEISNDPAMKNVIREIRNLMRDDKGVLDKKRQRDSDVNKDDTDMTYLLKE